MTLQKGTPEYEAFLARRREYRRARRAAMSPERIAIERASRLKWHHKNRERALASMIAWRLKNPGVSAASSRSWRELNPGKQSELNRAWKEANAERYAAYVERTRLEKNKKRQEWQKANPDKVRANAANRRARLAAADGSHSRDDVAALLRLQRHRCAVCTDRLDAAYEVDHIEPIARGGSNDRDNLQILCPLCNRRKAAKDPVSFMQEKGFLL